MLQYFKYTKTGGVFNKHTNDGGVGGVVAVAVLPSVTTDVRVVIRFCRHIPSMKKGDEKHLSVFYLMAKRIESCKCNTWCM